VQKIIFIVKVSRFLENFIFRQDFFKKTKIKKYFFGPLKAIIQFFFASSKNIDKNTPIFRLCISPRPEIWAI